MIYVGIDVAKDKHDCCILSSESKEPLCRFVFLNNAEGFQLFLQRIQAVEPDLRNVKVGLEATGHYCCNILGFLFDKGFDSYVINPLQTNQFRKSTSLRRTKTDRIDARVIAAMMKSDAFLTPYSASLYHNQALKSLTRYRFTKIQERAKLKQSLSRLVTMLFPELEKLVSTLHSQAVYALLAEFPSARQIAACHLTHLTHLLSDASHGHFNQEKAVEIRDAARHSIGSDLLVESMELQHTIRLIREFDAEIDEVEEKIQKAMDELQSPILSISGIGFRMGAMILAEIGDIARFDSPDKLLAYAGLSPTTYQSGKLVNAYSHMEKRGSRYLRYALFNAAKLVCIREPAFAAYLAKKRAEGKHYNAAIPHAVKKLVRLIFALLKSGRPFCPAT